MYVFSHLIGSFVIPGIAYFTGEAEGLREKAASNASCPHTTRTEFVADEFGSDGYVFGTELVG